MNRTGWIVAVAALVVALAGAAVFHMRNNVPSDLDLARSKSSDGKLYVVAIAPEKEPVVQGELHSWVLTLAAPDGKPVDGAQITVDGGMPQHGHGLPTGPQMTAALGQGRYRIEGVKFNMGGWWELKFAISAPPGDDSVTFNVSL